jgi:hypothetical protein
LRKVTISFVMSVRPSLRIEQLGSHWTDFHEIWYVIISRKSAKKIQSDKNNGYCTWIPIYIFDHIAHFFLELKMFFREKGCRKIKTLILYSINIYFFLKSCRLRDNVQKYIRAAQATDDNTAHARCPWIPRAMNIVCRNSNSCCLSTATLGARTRPLSHYTHIARLVTEYTELYLTYTFRSNLLNTDTQ